MENLVNIIGENGGVLEFALRPEIIIFSFVFPYNYKLCINIKKKL